MFVFVCVQMSWGFAMHTVYMDEHKQERGDGGLIKEFLGYHQLDHFLLS
jgi:hypothetical protein